MTPPYTAIGFLDRTGAIVAGFVFYGYVPGGNIDMAGACRGRLTRGVLRAIAHYAFEQSGARASRCARRRALTSAIDQLKRAGFKPEAVSPDWYGAGVAALQLRIRKTEAKRWL
jgi:hypothetical protein